MTTKLYTSNDDPPFAPATRRGAWDTALGSTDKILTRLMRGGSSGLIQSETDLSATYDRLIVRYVSDPLAAQTVAGTIDFNFLLRESDAAANMVMHVHAFLSAGDTNTVRGTLLTDWIDTNEWAVHASDHSALNVTGVALTSQAATAGDRLIIEIGYQAQNVVATSYTGGLKVGGSSEAATNETGVSASSTKSGWLQFSQTLLWTYSYLETTTTAAPTTPGAVRGTWDDTAAYDDYLFGASPAGSRVDRTKSETTTTNPWDMLANRYISAQLAAQTISSDISFLVPGYESNTAADAFAKFHLYVMKPDGTVRGTLLSNIVGGTEFSALGLSRSPTVSTPSSIAVTAGDRLVLEVGIRFTNVTAVSQSGIISSGGIAELAAADSIIGSGAVLSGWVQFRQVLDFSYVPPSGLSQVISIG